MSSRPKSSRDDRLSSWMGASPVSGPATQTWWVPASSRAISAPHGGLDGQKAVKHDPHEQPSEEQPRRQAVELDGRLAGVGSRDPDLVGPRQLSRNLGAPWGS